MFKKTIASVCIIALTTTFIVWFAYRENQNPQQNIIQSHQVNQKQRVNNHSAEKVDNSSLITIPIPFVLRNSNAPKIKAVLVDDLSKNQVRFTVSYEGIVRNSGYVPMVYTFDPDNCNECNKSNNVLLHPISHLEIIRSHNSSMVQYTVDVKETHCSQGKEVTTIQFYVYLADASLYLIGENSVVDDSMVIPFQKMWCD